MTPPELTYQHPVLTTAPTAVRPRASLVIEAQGHLTAVALREHQGLVIGRAEPSDVVLDDRSLSRTHARFTLRDGVVHVEDLGSTNGIVRDGERVPYAALQDGDRIELGAVHITVSAASKASAPKGFRSWGGFREACAQEIERAHLFGRSFSMLAVRSDAFRSHGISALLELLRGVDCATDHTPDTALVLLPETPAALALEIARKLHERLREPAACAVVSFPEDTTDVESLTEALVHEVRSAKFGATQRAQPSSSASGSKGPVIVSEAMQRLYALVGRIARADLPVLVLGETGAGKELVARAVHEHSVRAQGPFVAINCASIPPSLVESVLFGHERGAFTGATERRAGVFEQAIGGSVFLDEVGELTPAVQAALLRVLETKRVTRVGSTKELEVDTRVIAATHRDLASMVAAGAFREDLMFRLDALSLRVPPLRERVDEIEPLAERFLAQAKAQWGCLPIKLSQDAKSALRVYRWPGNVRQLKNVIERAAVVCMGDVIGLDDLPEVLALPSVDEAPVPSSMAAPIRASTAQGLAEHDPTLSFADRVSAFEARLLREALAKTGGNQTRAAALLKIPRRTLTNKVHALGIEGR